MSFVLAIGECFVSPDLVPVPEDRMVVSSEVVVMSTDWCYGLNFCSKNEIEWRFGIENFL